MPLLPIRHPIRNDLGNVGDPSKERHLVAPIDPPHRIVHPSQIGIRLARVHKRLLQLMPLPVRRILVLLQRDVLVQRGIQDGDDIPDRDESVVFDGDDPGKVGEYEEHLSRWGVRGRFVCVPFVDPERGGEAQVGAELACAALGEEVHRTKDGVYCHVRFCIE